MLKTKDGRSRKIAFVGFKSAEVSYNKSIFVYIFGAGYF